MIKTEKKNFDLKFKPDAASVHLHSILRYLRIDVLGLDVRQYTKLKVPTSTSIWTHMALAPTTCPVAFLSIPPRSSV